MKTAVHILGPLRPSGMEQMLVSTGALWQQSGWTLRIVGQGDTNPFAVELKMAGFRVDTVDDLRTLRGLRQLASVIRSQQPDVIHMHTERSHGPISVVARISAPRATLVRTVHSIFEIQGTRALRRRLQHAASRAVGTHHVAPSSDVARIEKAHWGLECQVIENWVSPDFSFDRPENTSLGKVDGLRVAIVGNCSSIKNHNPLLRALIKAENVTAVHIGSLDGADDEEQRLLTSLEGVGRAEVLGVRRDVAELLSTCHAFAMPSLREGMGIALAEALCLGKPCLVSDAPGFDWARSEPGVKVVRSDADWQGVLMALGGPDGRALEAAAWEARDKCRRRFSASRGVAEYVKVYERGK